MTRDFYPKYIKKSYKSIRKIQVCNREMGKRLNRHSIKEDIHLASVFKFLGI